MKLSCSSCQSLDWYLLIVLVNLGNQKDARGKFARSLLQLKKYSYTIEYFPGKLNVKADALRKILRATSTTDNFDIIFKDKISAINYNTKETIKNRTSIICALFFKKFNNLSRGKNFFSFS